jgi:hypothetical protein
MAQKPADSMDSDLDFLFLIHYVYFIRNELRKLPFPSQGRRGEMDHY